MLNTSKYFKEFLLVDADSRRAIEYVSNLDRDWSYGPVSVHQVGDKLQILFYEKEDKPKNIEIIRKAIILAERYGVSVRRVAFK